MTRDHLITRYTILRKKNLDLLKECRLEKSKITRYSLEKKRRRKENPLLWRFKWVRVILNNII
jgi:hypothetical protein